MCPAPARLAKPPACGAVSRQGASHVLQGRGAAAVATPAPTVRGHRLPASCLHAAAPARATRGVLLPLLPCEKRHLDAGVAAARLQHVRLCRVRQVASKW
eukprot:scaffold117623_cov75-Phaeocystis_antarctica.AAC.4